MLKECVLNELSLNDVDERGHDVLSLMERLIKLRNIVESPRISVWQGTRNPEVSIRGRVGELLGRARPARSDKIKMEIWRRAGSLLDRAEEFADEIAEDVRFDKEQARGLGRARRIGGLALSLCSAKRWCEPWLDVTVSTLRGDSQEIEERPGRVRHAAEEAHLAEHHDWHPLGDADRMRILLECSRTTHVPASGYRGGKHVKGTTNEQRAENACRPGGVSQYLAERGGEQVTDDVIRRWEQVALERVKSARPCAVEPRGGRTYWVFCDLGEPVGYEGGTGELTSCVRVEWSSGAVHSHPRQPPA